MQNLKPLPAFELPVVVDLSPSDVLAVARYYFYGDHEPKPEPCSTCVKYAGQGPSHNGSRNCSSGSIASGGTRAHCSCDCCY